MGWHPLGFAESTKPLPKAEGLEESSTTGVSFFWSEGCSSSAGVLGQDGGSADASRTCPLLGGLSPASLQGGSSECPQQLGEL